MPEENLYNNEKIEQNNDEQQYINQKNFVDKNSRNIANNTNTVRVAADVASKTADPTIKAIGTGVKIADKISGGKASEKLGKHLNLANKLTPGGALAQKAINMAAGNGMLSRLGSALSKRNGNAITSKFLGLGSKSSGDISNLESSNNNEDVSNEGDVSFENVKISVDFIKKALIAMIPISVIVIFCCLFISSTQIYINSIDLGTADSLSGTQIDDKIKQNEDNWYDEIKDDNSNLSSIIVPKSDIYVHNFDSVSNYIQIADRKYNEADLTKLKDFYGSLIDYNSEEGIDMYTVYTFFFKIFDIYDYYLKKYNIELDLPLLMSTLNIQSTNRTLIFSSNIEGYERIKSEDENVRIEEGRKKFDYTNTYNYESTANNSKYDIEVLVQNMISIQATEKCSDSTGKIVSTNIIRDNEIGTQVLVCEQGQTYSVTESKLKYDEEKYKEFLAKFIGKKYFSADTEEELKDNESLIHGKIVQIYDAKAQYEYLAGSKQIKPEIIPVTNNSFWFPIGSSDTEEIDGVLYAKGEPFTVAITSYFAAYDGFRTNAHSAIDVGNAGNGPGIINIIAAKSGEVVYPLNDSQTQFSDNGYYGNTDGGSYGNYVKIKHSDGTYTLYAHLAKNSITVRAGDVVDQGQVIGKMGHSGSSTGTHLHFEVRVGVDSYSNVVDPLNYVDPNNPRPVSAGIGDGFSLTYTTLSKDEFVAKLQDYYERASLQAHQLASFKKNFVDNAEDIYEVALENNLNPELVIVTAQAEQAFYLSPECQYTYNYWGLGITNGNGCNSGYKFDSIEDGVKGYAGLLSQYNENGNYSSEITSKYNERNVAGCDPAGHGLPGTLIGMQSLYSYIGEYRFNHGDSGIGGCYYFDYMYGKDYCDAKITCTDYTSSKAYNDEHCPAGSATTVCEQNDYTAWQVKKKVQIRYDIFGL